jgi:hypothetical protein
MNLPQLRVTTTLTMKRFILILLLAFAASALGLGLLARGPDFEVTFDRRVETELPLRTLSRSLLNAAHWPAWHHDASSAKASTTPLQTGSEVTLQVDPRGQKWKRFELKIRLEKVSSEPVSLQALLESDSNGKIFALFSEVRWTLEIHPEGLSSDGREKNSVIGQLKAKTKSARARILSRLAPRILLNQIFPADLQKLAGQVGVEGVDLSPRN